MITKTIRINRLQKLHDFLRELKTKSFDFGAWINNYDYEKSCGTVCCAIGWLPKIDPKNWKWNEDEEPSLIDSNGYNCDASSDGQEYFGIDEDLFDHMFIPNSQWRDEFGGKELTRHTTAKKVAKNIAVIIEKLKDNKLNEYIV